VYFPWPPLVARLSISKFCCLFTRASKLLFVIGTLLKICWSPKETAQRQASEIKIV
jgi:hypothetical protein